MYVIELDESLKEWVIYDPTSGIFTWKVKVNRSKSIGDKAGALVHGYIRIKIKGKAYSAHRMAWFFHYGENPPDIIDHINGVKDDNRIENLRSASSTQNGRNRKRWTNKSGYLGVSFREKEGFYAAHIRIDGKLRHLGCFATAITAARCAAKARRDHFGEFFNEALEELI